MMKFHENVWNFMKLTVLHPSQRRDCRNSMNYSSILHVLGLQIRAIPLICIISTKICEFHKTLKIAEIMDLLKFPSKRECRPRGALKNIRNDDDYVCFWSR